MQTAAKTPEPAIPKVKPQSFFNRQRRYRMQAKVWAILIAVGGCLLAWIFGFILIGALVLYADFLSRLLPHQLTEIYAYVMDRTGGLIGVSVAAVLFTAGLWWFAHRIFIRDTSTGLIGRSKARQPDPADDEEQKLVVVGKKLAITASAPLPAVLLFDGPAINAAVIGDRPERAGILVSRELLNTLDPEEQQSVIAHLLASAMNGDLHLTETLLRIFYMMGITVTLLDLPFSPGARKTIALLWRYARQPDQTSTAGDEIESALTRCLHPDGLESLTIVVRKLIGEETDLRSIGSTLLLVPLFPVFVLRIATGILYGVASLLILSPLTALVLRLRRKQSDTTTVQLTQNPDALARALIHLYGLAHVVPQAGWSEMNFIIGHEAASSRPFDRFRARIAEALTTANNFNHRLRGTTPAIVNAAATAQRGNTVAGHNFVFGFHPPLGMRIVQLKKTGAKAEWTERKDYSSWIIAAVVAAVVVGVLLLAPL